MVALLIELLYEVIAINIRREVLQLYAKGMKDISKPATTVKTRDWGRTLSRVIPTEIFQDPDNAMLFTSYFLQGAHIDNDNRLNGIVRYLLNKSAELLGAAIIVSGFMEATEDTKKANPLSYNPKQLEEETETALSAGANKNTELKAAEYKQLTCDRNKKCYKNN